MSFRLFPGYSLLLVVLPIAGCITAPPQPALPPSAPLVSRYSALVRLDPKEVPSFADDLDTASLRTSALQSLAYYEGLPNDRLFILGSDTYTVKDLTSSMAYLVSLLERSPDPKDWRPSLTNALVVYQSVGVDLDRTVVFSSYYEPTIPARAARDDRYKFPLYARPGDLVDADLSLFDSSYQGVRISGHREGRALVPYPARADIDGRKILQHQGLEIAWAKDPLDVLDLQIEGSGWLDFGKGNLTRVRYDGDNGRPYKSVGQYLIATGRIPAKKFNRKTFRSYLAHHPKKRQDLLNVNHRYVFFRIDASTAAPHAYGNIDVPLTPGRSIATDPKIFPKGALAWIEVTERESGRAGSLTPSLPRSTIRRFVLNQDEGGAIQGPGRVDIFAGHGDDAKRMATHLWHKGKLYFLVKPKSGRSGRGL